MPFSTLSVYEHQTLSIGQGVGADLSPAEARTLLDLGRTRPGFSTAGHGVVRLAQFVGLVNLGGRILEILPKLGADDDRGLCRGTLLRLLRLSHDIPLFTGGPVGHDLRRQGLLDVFANAFLQSLSALVRAGLLRRYCSIEEDIGTVRGRFAISRQVAVHGMRPDRLACRFDDLNIDNGWNQVLKAALLLVRPWSRSVETGRLWVELAAAFDEVNAPYDALALLETMRVDRQARHYEVALQWAGWILRLLSPNARGGSAQAPELLFDMNRLFESAVTSHLRRRARLRGLRVTGQDRGRHLATVDAEVARPIFRLRPDIVLRSDARVLSVADTKWSSILPDVTGMLVPDDSHVYQLNAYAGAYPAEEVVLIYPWQKKHEGARSASFRLPQVLGRRPVLHVVCVDVGSDSLDVRVSGDSLLAKLF